MYICGQPIKTGGAAVVRFSICRLPSAPNASTAVACAVAAAAAAAAAAVAAAAAAAAATNEAEIGNGG